MEQEHIPTNDRIEKGIVLMQSALRKFEEGDFERANNDRREANRNFDIAMQEMSTEDGKNDMMYGESRNFGMLYNVFENNTRNLYENNREGLTDIVKFIMENKVLSDQFSVYNAFMNPKNVKNTERYVDEALSLIPRYTKEELRENNTKFLDMLRKYNVNECVAVDDNTMDVFENIEYAIMNNKTMDNITKYSEIRENLSACVEENNVVDECGDIDLVYDKKVGEITEKYDEMLNDEEKSLVNKCGLSETKKRSMFENAKQKVLKCLSEEISKSKTNNDSVSLNEWTELNEKILAKAYSNSNWLVDMAEMVSAYEALSE
mgnify:CR=1 FL=1